MMRVAANYAVGFRTFARCGLEIFNRVNGEILVVCRRRDCLRERVFRVTFNSGSAGKYFIHHFSVWLQ